MHMRILSTLLLLGAVACGTASPSPGAPDDTTKFAGRWTYQPGSTIVADCPGAPAQTIDLSTTIGGQPAYFEMTSASAGIHEVDARGCQYDWAVSGDVATATSGQSCVTFPDGRGGARLVHLQSGSKTTTAGSSMAVDVHFTTDAPSSCMIHVQGTAMKS